MAPHSQSFLSQGTTSIFLLRAPGEPINIRFPRSHFQVAQKQGFPPPISSSILACSLTVDPLATHETVTLSSIKGVGRLLGQSGDSYELQSLEEKKKEATPLDHQLRRQERRQRKYQELLEREAMKFSHSVQFNAVPDWSSNYISYSNLKKLYVPFFPRPGHRRKGTVLLMGIS
jgi:hypothetical protein